MSTDGRILGNSPGILELRRTIQRLAPSDLRVLIRGETGSGKELVAQSIHEQGRQARAAFVAVNCAELTPSLAPSTLFGHLRGSYTDARSGRHGVFELADGGSLFFDEIGDLSLEVQGMLLRVLETGQFTPLGGERPSKASFRFVSATHRDLEAMVESGGFRRDLLHRITEAAVLVPALRERGEDIPLLARQFLLEAARANDLEPSTLGEEAVAALSRYSWPGNVRELKNYVRLLAIRHPGQPVCVGLLEADSDSRAGSESETTRILRALKQAGSIGMAARMLGMHRTTLWRKMSVLGLCRPCAGRRQPL